MLGELCGGSPHVAPPSTPPLPRSCADSAGYADVQGAGPAVAGALQQMGGVQSDPVFALMVAYESPLAGVPFDAAVVDAGSCESGSSGSFQWVACNSSKPGWLALHGQAGQKRARLQASFPHSTTPHCCAPAEGRCWQLRALFGIATSSRCPVPLPRRPPVCRAPVLGGHHQPGLCTPADAALPAPRGRQVQPAGGFGSAGVAQQLGHDSACAGRWALGAGVRCPCEGFSLDLAGPFLGALGLCCSAALAQAAYSLTAVREQRGLQLGEA